MIDLNELQIYSAVCETHSFTRAAERLGVPKSTVSRAVQALEHRLGARLLNRSTRSLQITEAGERYLEHCRRIVEEAEQADAEIAGLTAAPRGRLRVGAPGAFISTVLTSLLADFVLAYPELRVQVQLLGPDTIRDQSCDVAIWAGPIDRAQLFVAPVFRIRLGLYASARYLSGRTLPHVPSDLRAHKCITMNCGMTGEPAESVVWRLRRAGDTEDIRVGSHVAVPDPKIAHALAVGGAGIGLVAQFIGREDVAAGRLVRVMPDWEPEPAELRAYYSSRLATSPKVRAFLEFLRERFHAQQFMETDQAGTLMPVGTGRDTGRIAS